MPALANIYCHDVPSGMTLTGEMYPDGSDTAAAGGTGLTVTEQTNRKGSYVVNAGVAGLHLILLKSGSDVVAQKWSPSNLAITGDFEACETRWQALNNTAVLARPGDEMDLVDAPNAEAVTAIQSGLATTTELAKVPKSDGSVTWNPTAAAQIQAECEGAIVAKLLVASGTIGSTGNSTTALHLTGLPFGDDELNNLLIRVRDVSNSEYHARWISDWADTGDLATLHSALPFTPENGVDTYQVFVTRRDVSAAVSAGDVWDALAASYNTAGTMGAKLNSAASAGDPWSTELPGAYATNEAGEILGNLEAVLSAVGLRITRPDLGGELKSTIQGMDYANAIGNRLEWADINQDWPTLTGAAITVAIDQGDGSDLEFTGTVITATGSEKMVGLELTDTETAEIAVADGQDHTGWNYVVYATISGLKRPLRTGVWISNPLPAEP